MSLFMFVERLNGRFLILSYHENWQSDSCGNKKVKCRSEKPVYSFRPGQGSKDISRFKLARCSLKRHSRKIYIKISHQRRRKGRGRDLSAGEEECLRRTQSKVNQGLYGQMLCLSKMLTFSLWKCIDADQWAHELLKYPPMSLLPQTPTCCRRTLPKPLSSF